MRVRRALSSCGLALAFACALAAPATDRPARWRAEDGEVLVGGIQVREPDRERWLDRLHAVGFNTAALTVYATQGEWDSAEIRIDREAPWIAEEARAAKAAGLRVVLVLRVALDHGIARNRFLWHGMIQPRDDAELAAWFDRYGDFVARWAAVAEREGIDVLGIGSELGSLAATRQVDAVPALEAYYLDPAKQVERRERALRFEPDIDPRHLHGSWRETYEKLPEYLDDEIAAHRRWAEQVTGWRPGGGAGGAETAVAAINRRRRLLAAEWSELIERVRAVYGGALTYAANFDQYASVGFWPELDLIGVNAYFPLRRHPMGTAEVASIEPELEASWRRILGELEAFRGEAGAGDLPVLFTEIGYTTSADATLEPWSSRGFSLVGDWESPQLVVWDERERGFEERALAVRALRRASRDVDPALLRGLLWWKLSTVREHEAIEPFVLLIGEDAPVDPLLAELRAVRADPDGRFR